MKLKGITIIVASCLLSACAHTITTPPTNNADIELAEAATSVSHSLQSLAEVEQAVHPSAKVATPPPPSSYGMAGLTSIDWTGPVEPLVERIAAASGYQLRVLGQAPAIPIIISISAKNTPLGDILRDAGFQCGKRANVIVFPSNKTIELRYANT